MDEADRTLVGIIGAGRLGVAMARTVRRAGRNVVIANFRGAGFADVRGLDARRGRGRRDGGTPAAAGLVVLPVPWPRVSDAVQGLEWNGQSVIDATNDFDGNDWTGGRRASSSQTSFPAHTS
jgi:8-hydroxy-5-deazaflavin:NADPH oxidoreductase